MIVEIIVNSVIGAPYFETAGRVLLLYNRLLLGPRPSFSSFENIVMMSFLLASKKNQSAARHERRFILEELEKSHVTTTTPAATELLLPVLLLPKARTPEWLLLDVHQISHIEMIDSKETLMKNINIQYLHGE
jgi:hypothetical protein